MTEATDKPAGTAVVPQPPARKLDLTAIKAIEVRGGAMFLPSTMQECVDFATIMAKSDFAIPPRFRGNPGACLAVTIQASRWQADPFGVIQKAYVTKSKGGDERLAYEAQLFAAIVNTRAPIIGRLELVYSGEGSTRKVKVTGTFRDTGEIRSITTPEVKQIGVKNSPLWVSDPDQQLGYYGIRAWSRLWTPEILLGIYTPEEIAEEEVIDQPRPTRAAQVASSAPADEGIVRQAVEENPIQVGETLDELIPDPPPPPAEEPEPVAPITSEEAGRVDEMRVDAGEKHEVRAEEPVDDEPTESFVRWSDYLLRAVEGLQAPELLTEADFDDYAKRTKESLASADGLTDDEKDDLRARFVSAFLNVKRDRGFGRTRR